MADMIKTSAGKLKGNNRCNMRRGRHIDLNESKSPVVKKAAIQKNAVKTFFLAKNFVRKPHAKELARTLYKRYIMCDIPSEKVPEVLQEDVQTLKRILRLYDDNIGKWNPNEIFGLIEGVFAETGANPYLMKEYPVLKDYIFAEYKKLGDITERTCKLQSKKAYNKVRRYCGSENRLPIVPSESKVFDMYGLVEVEDMPDLVFFGENGESIEAVKLCCRKPDVTQTGKKKDKSAMQSMELFSKLTYARSLINDDRPHDIAGSFYFLGRNDDKKDNFEPYFFAPRGNNVVSLKETVYSEEVQKALVAVPDDYAHHLGDHFKPQFEEYKEGEICEKEACEHCEFEELCNYKPAPQCSTDEKAKKSVSDILLSKQQEDAVNFRKGIARINAVAGCGKTLIVALRTAYMLSEGIEPDEILLITFTNAGAAEMKERIEMYDEDLMTDSDMSELTCTTFNSFGDTIIKKEFERFGFTAEPRLIDDIERKEIITELLNLQVIEDLNYENFDMKNAGALPMTEIAFREIKKNRFSLYDLEEFKKVMAEFLHMKKDQVYHDTCKALLELFEVYDQTLKERNLIEFQDQEALLFDLLDQDPYYFEDNFGFKHIIVDEFQDTSDNQIELIKKLVDTSSFESLIVVGDDSQTIFEFRDAVTENIVEFFNKMGKEGHDFFITENHRSTPEILGFANDLIKKNKIRVEKALVPTRESGKPVEVEGFYTKSEEIDYIVNVIKDKLDEGMKPEDIAVLAATRAELIKINGALSENGIETSLQCPEPMLENPRVQGIISFSRMIADESASKDILNFENVLRDGNILQDFNDKQLEELIEKQREAIRTFHNLSYADKNKAFDATIEKLAHDDSVALNMVERLKRLPNIYEKQKYVEEFVRFGGEAVKREGRFSGVVLTTAHSSKGLEWPVIINSITGYDSKELGSKAEESKRRLLFVSSTRARDELYITGQYRLGKDESGEYINNRFLKEAHEAIGKEFTPRSAAEEKALKAKKKAEAAAEALSNAVNEKTA